MTSHSVVVLLILLFLTEFCDGQYSSCSYSYYSSGGTITSPNYPRNYDINSNCTYTVSTSIVSSISFTIRSLALESESRCGYDWVELSCSSNSLAVPVRFCGTGSNLQSVVFSPCTSAVAWFRTDGSVTSTGFSMDFRVYPAVCGNNCTLNSTSGCPTGCSIYRLSSYSTNQTCVCKMTSLHQTTATTCPPGCYYDYSFYGQRYCRCTQMTTAIQCPYGCTRRTDWRGDTSCDCSTDQTSVPCPYGCYYDRDFWGYRYCNCPASTQPPIWCSPGCTSDVNVYGERYCRCPSTTTTPCYSPCYYQYNYTYDYYGSRYCYCPPMTSHMTTAVGCGGIRTASYGIITSPNYPFNYPTVDDCTQYISVPQATSIKIQLLDVDVYYRNAYSCNYDYVQVTGCDGSVVTFCSIGTLSSSVLVFQCPSWYSTRTAIRLHSALINYNRVYRGLKVSYSATFASNCSDAGSYLSVGSSGVITSPNFPRSFSDLMECTNYLYTDQNDISIQIQFEQLRLESYSTCGYVFLTLSCVDYGSSVNRSVCGYTIPPMMTFDCKTLRIYFRSDYSIYSISPRYFSLRFTAVRRNDRQTERPPSDVSPSSKAFSASSIGLILGVGVGGFLLISLIFLIIAITVSYRRQMARMEQRHMEELTVLCRNIRSGRQGADADGNVSFSRNGFSGGFNNGLNSDLIAFDPPSYTFEAGDDPMPHGGGGGRGGGGRGGGRGGGGESEEIQMDVEDESDEVMLIP